MVTGGPYSHVELKFSDGVSFSSVTDHGPRFAFLIYDDAEWDYIDVPATAEDEWVVRRLAEMIDHRAKGYGWESIACDFQDVKYGVYSLGGAWHTWINHNTFMATEGDDA